uniref:Potassium channel KAT2 n=1 Tax=Cajanus cajan TaxID=3821 RepID=A0A151RRA0_CAJCA|nr:Potassium channel KAT2 [Cajanus cajan]
MLSHICLRFKTEGLKLQEPLNDLPKAVRSSIAHHLFFPVVQKVYLLQGVSLDFLFQMVSVMVAEYFPPKEDVILQNESSTELYVVQGKAVAVDAYGEIGVLYQIPQHFTVRTTELSQILRLNKTSLMNVLQANPGDAQIIMDNLEHKDIRNSETSLRKVTNDDHLVTKHNLIPKHDRIDPRSAAHKGNLDIVEILLERDANPDPNSKGWTQRAPIKQPKNEHL